MPVPSPLIRRLLAGLCCVLTLSACADRSAAPPGAAVRTVTIEMTEMRYSPPDVRTRVGEVITFRFVNKGTVRHEAVIGDQAAQDAAVAAMRQLDNGSTTSAPATSAPTTNPASAGRSIVVPAVPRLGDHRLFHPGMGLPNVVSVEPGQTGELTFSFAKAGELIIGCHETGHYEAGMKGRIVVEP